jgi:hypothetical protein
MWYSPLGAAHHVPFLVSLAWRLHLGLALTVLTACRESTTEPSTTAVPPSPPSLATSAWSIKRDLVSARYGLATATVTNSAGQSIVYAIGGSFLDNAIARKVQAYNVATNEWTTKAPLPIRVVHSNGAGVIKGKIYVSGGIGADEKRLSSLYMYDPTSNTWTQKRSMPNLGSSGVTGVINAKLYVLTSCFATECPVAGHALYRYDPVTDSWAILSAAPIHHQEGMAGVIGGKFYVVGGLHSRGRLDIYDPATNKWITKASLSSEDGRHAGAGTAMGSRLWVIGGRDVGLDGRNSRPLRTVSIYDPATDSWVNKRPLPIERYFMSATRVFVNGQPRIEVVGFVGPGNNLQSLP